MSRDALVVGISNYQQLPQLSAPAHDAEDIARCLESFGECRVVRLPEAIHNHKPIVSQQAGVTTQMLEAALIRLFKPSGKNIPHTAIFYFSGHGWQRNAGIQEGYLATSDTNPEAGNYGLSLYWLRRLLQESPVRQRVVILDCCNSGEFFNILEADPGAKAGTDRLFMAASREYEEAYESLTDSHSVFTQALLSGLNPYKVKGSIVNGHHLIDTVNNQLKGELQQPLFESSGSEIVLTRTGDHRTCDLHLQAEPTHSSALDRLKQGIYKYCPFQGLSPFQVPHGDFFFGRNDLTQSLVKMAQTHRLSVVTGASGIGKTSILQAGLMHTLSQHNQAQAEIHWDMRYVSLGHEPLKQLAEAFVDPQVTGLQRADQIRTAESFFHGQAQGMTQLVQASLSHHLAQGPGEPRILLIIDQFEALFLPTDDDTLVAQRQAVIDCLVAVVHKTHVPIHIVLGMRSQHLPALEAYPNLYELVRDHSLWVTPMTYDQLKATLVGPLDKVGLQYDANLIYTLLLDVVGAPGELALLQMALALLWQHRETQAGDHLPPRLTLETYVKLGGVRQILRQHATRVVESLPAGERSTAQHILMGLCEFSESSAPSRRQVGPAAFETPTFSSGQIETVANKLIAARLMVSHTNYECTESGEASHQAVPAWLSDTSDVACQNTFSQLFQQQSHLTAHLDKPGAYFEISHDSLLHNWPLYDDWLQHHRPFIRLQRSIEAAAQDWQRQQYPDHPDYGLSQTRLREALAFQTERGEYLSILAHQYLNLCSQQACKIKRKRNLMRLVIPFSMAMGMLTAYGYNRVIDLSYAQSPSGTPSTTLTTTAPFPPAQASHAPNPTPGRTTPKAPTSSINRPLQHSESGLSILPPRLNSRRPQSPQPIRSLFANAMAFSTQGLSQWQHHLATAGHFPSDAAVLAIPSNQDKVSRYAPSGITIDAMTEELFQPVAQWISPVDPQQMVQVWCTRHSAEPMCFAAPVLWQSVTDKAAAQL
jgi:hypothetical protein